MVHRFVSFEIDEGTREVRSGGRVLEVQPRVFDLLAFLARHRDRVVPKDELLDGVWPGVVVADGSLQRAVSLARSALASAGVENAIRTFARTGYRLCVESVADADEGPEAKVTTVESSPARQLTVRVQELLARPSPLREALATAVQLIDQAKALDPADAEVWAVGAQADFWHFFHRLDTSEARRERARSGSLRALTLDARSFEARLAQACVLMMGDMRPAARTEAETVLRELVEERPEETRALEMLANLLRDQPGGAEAVQLFARAGADNAAGWFLLTSGRLEAAMSIVDRLVTADASVANLLLKIAAEFCGREDLDTALATLERLPASLLWEDHAACFAGYLHLYRGSPDKVLEVMWGIPRDWLAAGNYVGPKGWWNGRAHQLAGRTIAAQAEWGGALAGVEERLAEQRNSPLLLRWQALLQAHLGELDAARRSFELERELSGRAVGEYHDQFALETGLLLGHEEAVVAWLQRTLREPPNRLWFMHAIVRFDPIYAPLRASPVVRELLRETLAVGAKAFALET